jgi:hypothetical protein
MKKLLYVGTGIVLIEGSGEVASGGTIEVPDETAKALLLEQPQHFKEASAPARSSRKRGGD